MALTAATLYPRLARLALACIDRGYPYASHHVHTAPADTGARLHPAFGGCFDWHSAVHAHWCLARIMRLLPRAETNSRSAAALSRHLTPSAVAAEVAYLRRPEAHSFEAPYGWAWLLALAAELARLRVAPAARRGPACAASGGGHGGRGVYRRLPREPLVGDLHPVLPQRDGRLSRRGRRRGPSAVTVADLTRQVVEPDAGVAAGPRLTRCSVNCPVGRLGRPVGRCAPPWTVAFNRTGTGWRGLAWWHVPWCRPGIPSGTSTATRRRPGRPGVAAHGAAWGGLPTRVRCLR